MNHRYLIRKAREVMPPSGGRVLDYGCGTGDLIEVGRAEGLDFYGAEVFYAGGDTREAVAERGWLGTVVGEITDGRAPFDDGFFDVVVSNQVIEHVEDLDVLLADVARLLKPGGWFISLFPSKEVLRDDHCGLPLIHWFEKGSTMQYAYALTLRRLGLGAHKMGKPADVWARDFVDWLERYTFYRARRDILAAMERHFHVVSMEADHVRFRLADRSIDLPAPIGNSRFGGALMAAAFRRLGGLAVGAQKPAR